MSTDLSQRVAELEQRLSAVEAELAIKRRTPPLTAAPQQPAPPQQPPLIPKIDWDALGSGEGWLGRAGIGLLVVGLILLFRYAVARGWLTPELRIGIGLVVGMSLLASGTALFPERRLYRQILMGGGIVILFITGLASVELYHLVRGPIALLFFIALAGAAFTIAAKQEEPTIASIGALGALIPPAFLLEHSVPGAMLWLYLLVMVIWTGVLVVTRGWQLTVILTAAASLVAMYHSPPPTRNAQIAAGFALTGVWLCFAALPLLRARLLHGRPPLHAVLLLALPMLTTIVVGAAAQYLLRSAHIFESTMLIAALGFTGIATWLHKFRDDDPVHGTVKLFGELYVVDGFGATAMASVISLAAAAITGLPHPWWPAGTAAVAAIGLIARRVVGLDLLRPVAHALNALLALAFLLAVDTIATNPAFDRLAISYALAALIAALVALEFFDTRERVLYLAGVYFAALVLLATELTAVQAAPWLASASYGIVGSVMLLAGLARRQPLVQRAGMLSLALLVGRLFLYDLAKVDVGVRIVLFMVCGGVFLGLSYLVRSRRFAG